MRREARTLLERNKKEKLELAYSSKSAQESRQKHARNRKRGKGGRFLSKKEVRDLEEEEERKTEHDQESSSQLEGNGRRKGGRRKKRSLDDGEGQTRAMDIGQLRT